MTTALERYAKLEAVAVYVPGPAQPAREVVLGFGARTLTILTLDDQAIGHWPLASLRAIDTESDAVQDDGTATLTLAPDHTSAERLHLSDQLMIDAIRTVAEDLDSKPTGPAATVARRRWLPWAVLAGAALIAVFWGASQRLSDWISDEHEALLGARLAEELPGVIAARTGKFPERCVAPEGRAALDRVMKRVLPDTGRAATVRISILRQPEAVLLTLPGGRIYIADMLLRAARSPEEVAGLVSHAAGHHLSRHAIGRALEAAGPLSRLRIVVTGGVDAAEAESLVRALIDDPYSAADEAEAAAWAYPMLGAAKLPATALNEFTRGASDASASFRSRHSDPGRAERARKADSIGDSAFEPALSDRNWIALQNICDRTVLP